jgi:dephospho-CoA kinase
VEFFRKQKGFVLLAVDAPIEVRYARTRARGRDESATTFDEFRRKEELEMAGNETEQQIALCMAMADRTIFNDGTIEELHRKVEELL